MSNPEREFSGCTRDVFHRNIEEDEPFCTQDNWQSAVMYLNQDIELQGLPSIYNVEQGQSQLDVISLINVTWALLQTQKEKQRKISEQDAQVRRLNGDIEHLQTNSSRLRDLIEYKERQASDLECREKQAQESCTQFRNELKVAKDEIKKLSSLVLNREGRFNHEAKKKDQELCKLKERLLKVMSTETKQVGTTSSRQGISIEVVGHWVEKAEGQTRGRWRTENEDQKRGDDLLQKVILANQERNGFLAQELHNLQEKLNYFLVQLSTQVGQELRLPTFLPTHSEAFSREWQAILLKVKGALPPDSRAENIENNDQHQSVQEAFNLSSFVPLSEVKHTAPPEWVSRAAFTLPPSGKAETVKLRGGSSESKPRPKSSHVSPYRGMQARNNTPNYRSKPSYRSGSMSPNSTSPTRNGPGDTRSLPRLTGTKLSLKTQSPTSCSSNNSSADESSTGGAYNTYKRLVSKRSLSRGASRPLSPTNQTKQSEESANESLSLQLKKLGKYLEQKQQTLSDGDDQKNDDIFDPLMDEHLANIRKALAKSPK